MGSLGELAEWEVEKLGRSLKKIEYLELDVGETPEENVPVGAGSWGGPEVWQGKLEKWKWMKLEFGGVVMSNLRKKD